MNSKIIKMLEAKKRRKRKNKNKITVTYTTGDPLLNIKHFNRLMGTDFSNPSTEEAKEAAKAANADMGVNSNFTDGNADISEIVGSATEGESSGSDTGGEDMGESLKLSEAKREVRRYYIRPQHIFCANKSEVIKALIDIGNNNCSVYTLKFLGDEKDVTKLTTRDIIYYYDDGILYDKNHVKVMDYDLYIKHEEERKKFAGDIEDVPDAEFIDEYSDRLTPQTEFEESRNTKTAFKKALKLQESENPFEMDFPNINAFGEDLDNPHTTCCICGEEFSGYGNNPAPIKHSGRCCDACNLKFVLPARLDQMKAEDDDYYDNEDYSEED